MQQKPDHEGKWPTALWVGVGLSVVWLAILIVYAVSPTVEASGSTAEPISRWRAFWQSPPNNFGDALAGIFAPLAFLWLVVATFLQKEELISQRHELEQSRKALQLQAQELNASVEQLSLQTTIMKNEHDRSVAELQSRSYESRLVRWALGYHTLLSAMQACEVVIQLNASQSISRNFFRMSPDHLLKLLDTSRTEDMCAAILSSLSQTRKELSDERCEATASIGKYDDFIGLLRNCHSGAESIVASAMMDPSELPLVTIRRVGLERILAELRDCIQLFTHHRRLRESWDA